MPVLRGAVSIDVETPRYYGLTVTDTEPTSTFLIELWSKYRLLRSALGFTQRIG